jgi:hypothetical protein
MLAIKAECQRFSPFVENVEICFNLRPLNDVKKVRSKDRIKPFQNKQVRGGITGKISM